jgi:ABC-type uncharacterized transport system substrate-binding protein
MAAKASADHGLTMDQSLKRQPSTTAIVRAGQIESTTTTELPVVLAAAHTQLSARGLSSADRGGSH